MQKITVENYKTCDYKDVDLEKRFHPETPPKRSFAFRNRTVASPYATGEGKLSVTFCELPPGQTNYPYHHHSGIEEVYYIIRGTAILKCPEGERTVSEGDVIVLPANENGAHQMTNPSDTETVVFLDIDTTCRPEVVFFPDTNKFRIFTSNHTDSFLLKDSVNYLDQE